MKQTKWSSFPLENMSGLFFCLFALTNLNAQTITGHVETGFDSPAVPHVTQPGNGFKTRLIIPNLYGEETKHITLVARDAAGEILSFDDVEVPVGQVEVLNASAPALSVPGVASMQVLTPQLDADPGVLYSYEYEHGQASPAVFQLNQAKSHKYLLFPGNWSLDFDSYAIYNSSIAPIRVTIRQRTYSGEILRELVHEELEAHSNTKAVLGGPGVAAFEARPDSYFEFEGTDFFVLLGLRSNASGLWPNYPQAEKPPLPEVVSSSLDNQVIARGGQVTYRLKTKYATKVKVIFNIDAEPGNTAGSFQTYAGQTVSGELQQSFGGWPASGTIWAEVTGPGGTITTPALQVTVQ